MGRVYDVPSRSPRPGRLGALTPYAGRMPAPTPIDVYLARHGQTAYNLEGRFQGQQQIPLDDTGREQALELAERAAGLRLPGAVDQPAPAGARNGRPVARRLGLEPREDARLMETDAGDWTDRTFAEVQARAPERFAAFVAGDPGFAFPGGESFAAQERPRRRPRSMTSNRASCRRWWSATGW